MNNILGKYEIELRVIGLDEPIPPGALHSTNGGVTLRPMMRPEESVGQTPRQFAKDRIFFEPLIAIAIG